MLVAAAATAPMNALRVHPAVTLTDAFLVVVTCLLVLSSREDDAVEAGSAVMWVLGGLGLVTIGGALSSIVASDESGLGLLMRSAPAAGATTLVVVATLRHEWQVRAVAFAYACGAAVSVVGGEVLGRVNPVVGRSFGLAVDSNHYAFSCVLASAAGAYVALTRGSTSLRVVAAVATVTSLSGVLLSGSRAGAVGAMVVLACVAVVLSRRGLLGAVTALGGSGVLVTAAVLLGGANNAIARLFGLTQGGAISAQLSDDSRRVLLADLIGALQSSPFVGLGWSRIREAHIHLLQVAVGAGVLGVIGYLCVTVGLARAALALSGLEPPHLALAGGLVAFVAMGMGQNILWDRYVWIFLSTALVTAALPRAPARSPASRTECR
jgi:hypothetical protein